MSAADERDIGLDSAEAEAAAMPASRRISWRLIRPYLEGRGRLPLLSAASVVSGFAEAAMLVLIVQIAFSLGEGRELVDLELGPLRLGSFQLPALLAFTVTLALLVFALQAASSYVAAQMSANSLASARKRLFGLYVGASWSLQSDEREGHLQELLSTHAYQASMAVIWIATGLAALFNFLALLLSALVVDALAAAIILGLVAALYAAVRPVIRYSRRQAGRQAEENARYAMAAAESVTVAREVATFDVGEAMDRRLEERADRVTGPYFRMKFVGKLIPELYRNAGFLFVLVGMGAVHAWRIAELESLSAVVLLLLRGLGYTQILQRVVVHLHQLMPYLERLEEQQGQYRRARVKRGGVPVGRIDELEFDRVSFFYSPDRPALDGVSFLVERGEAIGIVGPSGAGKSTLVELLLRLREPTSGRYLVNGRDAALYSRPDWYRRIGVVPQDSRLFSGTLGENIRFFRDDLEAGALEDAARRAHIHDEIAALPEGYETPAGERGGHLSGGQRQRICLARALAGDPDVIFLDEPTSALDLKSESLIQQTLEQLKGRVTLFIVAHRLSTLNICDRIMALGEGRLQAFDAPAALRESNPFFREAVKLSRLR